MNLLIISNELLETEFKNRLTHSNASINFVNNYLSNPNEYNKYDAIIDSIFHDEIDELNTILSSSAKLVMVNSVKTTLLELSHYLDGDTSKLFGVSALPTFVEREKWEVSTLKNSNKEILNKCIEELSCSYILSDDRAGMISARVIAMIINEAYFTLMEGTASKKDIDKGMKLGTNYPFGPFEWCGKIGLTHIYELLESLYDETKEEQYKISPLLRKEYLQSI